MFKALLREVGIRSIRTKSIAVIFAVACLVALPLQAKAQDRDQDDPPSRVARLAHIEGSVSFQPAGEDQWVEAVSNRPMTTGDKLWVDRDSRAEVQLGSASIQIGSGTGFSFLNLDDHTIQIQLSAGKLNMRIWDLDRDDVFEVDTPNQAFTARQPGRYRIDAAEDGNYTEVTIHRGEGESTGNGQSYTMHSGQRFTFSGTSSLNAEVAQIGAPDDFDEWSERRERRYEDSPSARYVSRDVVGFQDLDEYGDWRPTPQYGHVWFPRVEVGWAPYHQGHWAWIEPWGWTWVDDSRWGYAPFHYGRWVSVYGRWGWIPGPREEHPVYAPALVAFVGTFGTGGHVAWFPLGPREVYVPSYHVSQTYVNRVNVSNTTVNVVQVTKVYNTTIINNNTTINNVTYVNRNVRGAVTMVPQQAFATAQPVQKTAVIVNEHQLRTVPVMARAAVPPAPQAVLGVHNNLSARVIAPPVAIANRPVIAKTAPPLPPPSFAVRQQVLREHPGVPVPRAEMERMRPANAPAPLVRQVSPVRPATPAAVATEPDHRGEHGHAGNPPAWGRPQPGNAPMMSNGPDQQRGFEPRNDHPGSAQQNSRPDSAPGQWNNRPDQQRGFEQPRNDRPASAQQNSRPDTPPGQLNNRPDQQRGFESPRNDRPDSAQQNSRPDTPPGQMNNRPDQQRGFESPRNDRPDSAPGQMNNRPDQPRGFEQPRNDRPSSAQQNSRPDSAPGQMNNRPEPAQAQPSRPSEPVATPRNDHPAAAPADYHPNAAPAVLNNRSESNHAEPVHSSETPAAPHNDRPASAQPNNHPAEQSHNQPAPHSDNAPSSHSQSNASADSHSAAHQQSKQSSGKQEDHKNDNKQH